MAVAAAAFDINVFVVVGLFLFSLFKTENSFFLVGVTCKLYIAERQKKNYIFERINPWILDKHRF